MKKSILVTIVTMVLVFSWCSPLMLGMLIVDIVGNNMFSIFNILFDVLNLTMLVLFVPSIVKTYKGLREFLKA